MITRPDETLFKTKWMALKQRQYRLKTGETGLWDFIERTSPHGIVTMLCSAPGNRYLLIRQYRPPVDKVVIEFPAGLIDPGESPEEAALRELAEETGYRGTVTGMSSLLPKSPGLTSEATYLVFVSVDESRKGQTAMDLTEDIMSFWATPDEFMNLADNLKRDSEAIDTQVWNFFAGMTMGSR